MRRYIYKQVSLIPHSRALAVVPRPHTDKFESRAVGSNNSAVPIAASVGNEIHG